MLRKSLISVLVFFAVLIFFQHANQKNEGKAFEGEYIKALKLIGQEKSDESLKILKNIIEMDSTFSRAHRKIVEIHKR